MKTTVLLLLFSVVLVISVDRSKFKKCSDVPFCVRHKSYVPNSLKYHFEGPLMEHEGRIQGKIGESITGSKLLIDLTPYEEGVVRLRIKEENPIWPRYEVEEVLVSNPVKEGFQGVTAGEGGLLNIDLGSDYSFSIDAQKFRFDYLVGKNAVLSANKDGKFYFEHQRHQNENKVEIKDADPGSNPLEFGQAETAKAGVVPGVNFEHAWTQTWGGSIDENPKGPQSVGMDISFIGADEVYGIPEHATDFALKSTDGSEGGYNEPYRLFNLDVFEYELNEPMALYVSVPFMMGQSQNLTTAVFWLNAAETFVDIEKKKGSTGGIFSGILGRSDDTQSINSHWRSESGIIDVFFMVGPTPNDIFRKFTALTGRPTLPPLFSIAYHQCRWNYKDEADVADVHSNFETHDIPFDVIWLDIEHTDGKRYFTWDPKYFPNPINMLGELARNGRKMVTIVDPHIKRDDNFIVHKLARDNGHYIKDGSNDYDGFCWSGSSSWVDYLSPASRDWWAERFEYQNYVGSTPDLFIWNDMNEPSVFNGPEVSIRRTAIHHGGWENRDIHNLYGMLMQRATAEGLIKRNPGHNKRPFALARAGFAGSQRWGAIWTGDNAGQWSHLEVSTPMLLSLSISGIVFSGADVGGFFGNPEPELLLRWYQAGAYQPFFRAHAHHDAKRREPWVFGEPWTGLIRKAIISRYQILPYLYTLFYQSSLSGVPIMRPLFSEFPHDKSTYKIQNEFLLGPALLVHPIAKPEQTSAEVYLPGDQPWYETATLQKYSPGTHTVSAPMDRIPVFQRGGTIVARKMRLRRSTTQMKNDPFTLVVALNDKLHATGELYVDDGETFDHQQGNFIYRKIEFTKANSENVYDIRSTSLAPHAKYYTRAKIEAIKVLGLDRAPVSVHVLDNQEAHPRQLNFVFDKNTHTLTIKKPDVIVSAFWNVELTF